MGVSKNRGGPPKWMVKIMENPINPWMIWGENPLLAAPTFRPLFQYLRPSRPALPPGAAPGRPAGMHGPVGYAPKKMAGGWVVGWLVGWGGWLEVMIWFLFQNKKLGSWFLGS